MSEEIDNNEKKEVQESEESQPLTSFSNEVVLHTHELTNSSYSGELDELKDGFSKVILDTTEDMRVDSYGLVHGGFLFSAADFAAMAAVNDPNVVLSSAETNFLSPVRVGDKVVFTAKVRHKDGRKRDVQVYGHVFDIKVFESVMKTVVLEKHVLKLNLMHASKI